MRRIWVHWMMVGSVGVMGALGSSWALAIAVSGQSPEVPQAVSEPMPVFPVPRLSPPERRLKMSPSTPKALWPFWKSKALVYKKIREERSVIVAVRKEDLSNKLIKFTVRGAGHVRASQKFALETAQNYEQLQQVSSHFKTVRYESKSEQLFLVLSALGYQARMILKIVPVTEGDRSELQWEVVWGAFQGMQGYLGFEKVDTQTTEVSIEAEYISETLPLPKILMGFALEVVTQKVAEGMRTFIEARAGKAGT